MFRSGLEPAALDAVDASSRYVLPTLTIPQSIHLRKSFIMENLKSHREELESSIMLLESVQALVERAKVNMQQHLLSIFTYSAPISAVSPELLEMIFQHTKDSYVYGWDDPSKSLLAISHTSRMWRSVIVNQQSVWRRIHAEWPQEQQNIWLERSGCRLLDVVFNYRSNYDGDSVDMPRLMSDDDYPGLPVPSPDLVSTASNWQFLSFQQSSMAFPEDYINTYIPATTTFQSLEFLETRDCYDSPGGDIIERVFRLAPRLSSLRAYDSVLFEMSGIENTLIHLALYDTIFDDGKIDSILFPRLSTLYIRTTDTLDVFDSASVIRAPKLRCLTLNLKGFRNRGSLDFIRTFVSDYRSPIALSSHVITQSTLGECLSSSP